MSEDRSWGSPWRTSLGRDLRETLESATSVVSRVWSFQTREKIRSLSVRPADTGAGCVLVGSEDGTAYMLGGDGSLLWRHDSGAWVRGVDFSGTGEHDVAVVGSDIVRTIDISGSVVHEFPCESPVSCLRVVSTSQQTVIISGHDDGLVKATDLAGALLWKAQFPKRIVSVECCDVDLDGKIEVAAACEDTNVYIINESGEIQDRFRTSHWIISLAVGDVYADGIPRLLIAGFNGDIYVYGGGKTAALRVRRRGIVGLAMGRLSVGSTREYFVVGTSDQRVTIFEPSGRELWRFTTSFGNRVIRILESEPDASLILGAEDGNAHRVALRIRDGLREQIVSSARRLGLREPPTTELSPAAGIIFSDLLDLEEQTSSYSRSIALEKAALGQAHEAVAEFLGYWRMGGEEEWKFKTGGRVYSVAVLEMEEGGGRILAASGDGCVYALQTMDGAQVWCFRASGPVRGAQWVRDDPKFGPGALVGSEDGCVYRLDERGRPIWHLQTGNWVLYVAVSDRPWVDDSTPVAWFGSEGCYVEAIDRTGRGVWRVRTEDRVRAVVVTDVDGDGADEVVAGSDDRSVYIIDALTGNVKYRFAVPHWILVVAVNDIDQDGSQEIMVGTEDGSCYVYNRHGELKWSFRTNYWVAAIDSCVCPAGNIEVAVGSADSFIYGLTASGVENWRWQTGARVRTIAGCGSDGSDCMRLAYGSYDEYVHVIRRSYGTEYRRVAVDVFNHLQQASIKNRDVIPGIRAIETLAYDRELYAIEVFEETHLNTEKAIASAVLLANPKVQDNADLLKSIARFLLYDASEDEYRAVLRTASDLRPTGNALLNMAKVMRSLDDSAEAQNRAAAVLSVGAS